MRPSIKARLFALGALALLAAAPAHAQQAAEAASYEVRFFRPAKAGERYRLNSIGTQGREAIVRTGDKTEREAQDSYKIELTGEAETLLADEKGNALAVTVKVLSLIKVDGLRRDELIPPATQVVERRVGSRQVFEIGGNVIEGPLKNALDVVLSETNDPRAPTDDELMGTKDKKKAGERWPVDRPAMARFITSDEEVGLDVKPEDVTGDAVLKGLERCGQADCMRVEVAATLGATPRAVKALSGVPEKAKIEIGVSVLLPLDTSLGAWAETSQIKMTFSRAIAGPEGQAQTVEAIWQQSTDRKMTPIP